MNNGFRNILLCIPSWMFSIVCTAAILWLTLSPSPLGELHMSFFVGADKVVHAIMFGGLTFCILVDVWRKKRFNQPSKIEFVYATISSVLLGGLIELVQGAAGLGRDAEIMDFVADGLGAVAVSSGWFIIERIYGRKTR